MLATNLNDKNGCACYKNDAKYKLAQAVASRENHTLIFRATGDSDTLYGRKLDGIQAQGLRAAQMVHQSLLEDDSVLGGTRTSSYRCSCPCFRIHRTFVQPITPLHD